MRVLIAEDDASSRMILKTILTKWRYEVVETCNGKEAWEALQKEDAPRLVILDWMMPAMSGEKICQELRETQSLKPTYIILLTAKRTTEDVVSGLEAGANDYIHKPFYPSELWARVRVGERVLELESALAEQVRALRDALAHVRTLQGLLPICMRCHKIRNDQQSWERLEKYISKHTDAKVSYGLCPECTKEYCGTLVPE